MGNFHSKINWSGQDSMTEIVGHKPVVKIKGNICSEITQKQNETNPLTGLFSSIICYDVSVYHSVIA